MRESRTYGSVRGAGSDLRPYRDRPRRCSNSAAIWENTGRDSNVIAKAALNPKVTAVRLHPGLHIGGADHLGRQLIRLCFMLTSVWPTCVAGRKAR